MIFILGITIGFLIGGVSYHHYLKNKINNSTPKRKGVMKRSYQNGDKEWEVQWEVEIVEQTKELSKIKVISGVATSAFGSQKLKECIPLIDNLWVYSSEINLVEDTLEKKRLDKLKEILN